MEKKAGLIRTGFVVFLLLAAAFAPLLLGFCSSAIAEERARTVAECMNGNISPRPCTNYTAGNPPPKVGNNYTLAGTDSWLLDMDATYAGNVTLYDQSKLIIRDANVTLYGWVWGRNESSVEITNAYVRMNITGISPVLVKEQYNKPNGFMLIEDHARFTVWNSYFWIQRHDKYNPGKVDYVVPSEVFVSFGTSTITDSILDGKGTFNNSTGHVFSVNRSGCMHGDSQFNVVNTIMPGFICYVNAHGAIERSTVRSLPVNENTGRMNIFVGNSSITGMSVRWNSGVTLYNSTISSNIIVGEEADLHLLSNSTVNVTIPVNSQVMNNANLFVSHSKIINDLDILDNGTVEFDNASLSPNKVCNIGNNGTLTIAEGSWISHVFCSDNATLSLNDSAIDNLTARDNSVTRLKHSAINKVANYQDCLEDNATIYIDTILVVVTATVNGKPMPLHMDCLDNLGNRLYSTLTDRPVAFSVTRQVITKTSINTMPYCVISVYRGALSYSKQVDLTPTTDAVTIQVPLTDNDKPDIKDVSFELYDAIGAVDALVRARVSDGGIGVSRAVLRYSVNDGVNWTDLQMYLIGNDTYELTIPGQKPGTKVLFYIYAEDFCLNNATSQRLTYSVPTLAFTLGLSFLVILIILLAVAIVMAVRKHLIKRRFIRPKKKGKKSDE